MSDQLALCRQFMLDQWAAEEANRRWNPFAALAVFALLELVIGVLIWVLT